jgi:putative phosphoesterase
MDHNNIVVGIIADTHGLLRPEALAELSGSDLIVHAGDIGTAGLIEELGRIAPTFAVRGNVDTGPWAAGLPATAVVAVGAHKFYLLHDVAELDLDPAAAGFAAVIYGHSHQPAVETRDDVLFLNPGSAGPRRFSLPVTLARVRVTNGELHPDIVVLEP